MTSTSYLRFPHVRGELITFVAEDDLWLADIPADGGAPSRAWRVTSDRLPAARPRLSPDGSRIAWTGWRDGANPEAYSMPTDGGDVVRLTHWSTVLTGVRQWISDSEVAVVSGARAGHRGMEVSYAVPADGGLARKLTRYGNHYDLDVLGPEGAALVMRGYAREPAHWKRYRGGRAGKFWLDGDGDGEFRRFLTEVDGNLADPMWVGARAAFASDHEGVGEIYSCLPEGDGTDLRKHSDGPAGFYARHAATDGVRVVFERAGGLWLLENLDGAEPRRLDIRLTGTRVGRSRHPVATAEFLGDVSPDKTGRASAVEVRGTVHWLTHKDGPARVLLHEDGVRGRVPVTLGDTGDVAWITDAEGDDALEIAAADGSGERRRVLCGELGRVLELVSSPDGRHLAAVTHDNRLLVIDVEAGTSRVAASGTFAGWSYSLASQPVFSPDSAWLAWTQATETAFVVQIRMADVASLTAVDVTEPRFKDVSPAFTQDGKHLAFLSARTFDPYEQELMFDLAFTPATRPYLVPLAEIEPSPFAPQLGGRPAGADAADADGAAESTSDPEADADSDSSSDFSSDSSADSDSGSETAAKKNQPPKSVVDREGLATRVVPFPVAAGNYSDLKAAKGGVLWLEVPVAGDLGESRAHLGDDPDRSRLRRFDFTKREVATLVDELDGYAVSGDGKRVVVRDHGKLRVQSAESRPDNGDREPLDLDRIRVTVDPVAERRMSYHEAWRLQRDNFWRADMNGVDWDAVRVKYASLTEAVATHDDFVDLLWELHGELGTSHAYANPRPLPTPAAKRQGMLGADLTRDESGVWRIERILPGDSSVLAARSPLAAPGVAARTGDAVEAVDGRRVTAEHGVAPLLAGKVGKPVELTLRRADADESRRVMIVPTGDETALRYLAHVADRRAYVHQQSGGRLGYVHSPDQGTYGWAEFHRDFGTQIVKEGLIVDTRGNRGGHTSELVVEKLIRKPIAWDLVRNAEPGSYPSQSPRGPVVSVCDETSASDGDIINQALQDHGVTVVGVRTWGGVVGIDGLYELVDGTSVTQPKYAFWFESRGFAVENHGVDPTIEVHRSPQDFAAGRDPQLDAAIRAALDDLEVRPAATPPPMPGI